MEAGSNEDNEVVEVEDNNREETSLTLRLRRKRLHALTIISQKAAKDLTKFDVKELIDGGDDMARIFQKERENDALFKNLLFHASGREEAAVKLGFIICTKCNEILSSSGGGHVKWALKVFGDNLQEFKETPGFSQGQSIH